MNNKEKKFVLDFQLSEFHNDVEVCIQSNILETFDRFKNEIQSNITSYIKKKALKKTKFEMIVNLSIIQEQGTETTSFLILVCRRFCVGIKNAFNIMDIIRKILSKFIESKLNNMVN